MIKGINKRKVVYDYELLGSLGIQSIGLRIFQKILSIMDIETLINLSVENRLAINLIGLPGFGEKTANRVEKGINSKIKTIRFLLNTLSLKEKVDRSKLKGKVCFSQIRDPEFESKLLKNGYDVTDSLTKNVDILIVPNLNMTSSKITKAKKYGITIMDIENARYKLI
jgi:NAD-dependent DNA ligase